MPKPRVYMLRGVIFIILFLSGSVYIAKELVGVSIIMPRCRCVHDSFLKNKIETCI